MGVGRLVMWVRSGACMVIGAREATNADNFGGVLLVTELENIKC